MTLVLRYAARSDRGLVRQNNQDSVYAGPRLLALADGMGGHAAGEVASRVVIAALAPLDDEDPSNDLLTPLREATRSGNAEIRELVADDPELEGMGTTLTAVLFAGKKLGVAHIGDSRAYLVRDGMLSQITHDDTFVQSLIDEGRITSDEAETHPQRSLLLKALTGHEVEPSLTIREARAGDRYLLCSDGLSGVVSEDTLGEGLRIPDPQDCADRLIELALKGGGPDNVTVVVADVVDVDFGDDAPVVGGALGNGEESPRPNSAAARASATTLPHPAQAPAPAEAPSPPAVAEPARGKRRLRWLIVAAVVVVVLIAAGIVGYFLMFSQYFVGLNDNEQVTIYRGAPDGVLGVPLHRAVETVCLPGSDSANGCEPLHLSHLQGVIRPVLEDGNQNVEGIEDARQWVDQTLLQRYLLPPCEATSEQDDKADASLGAQPPPDPEAPPAGPQQPGAQPPEAQPPEAQQPGAQQPQDGATPKPGMDSRGSQVPGVDCRAGTG